MSIVVLDALLNRIDELQIADGYNYDWHSVRSAGNGTRATVSPDASCSVKFGLDTINNMQHQDKYPVSVVVTMLAVVGYDATVEFTEQDYEVQVAVQSVLDDFRRGFGLCTQDMVDAGIERCDYIGQATTDRISGHEINVAMNFQVEYFAERWH